MRPLIRLSPGRRLLWTGAVAALVVIALALSSSAQQPDPPASSLSWQARIAPSGEPGAARPPRLRGWARTDAEGRYEFRTIRPARYPGDGPPAHVHFYLTGPGYPRQEAEELQFEGDPKVTPDMAERSRRAGRFGGVRPLTRGTDGVWHCTFDMRLRLTPN
jgi:Dioxygenase